MRARKQRTSRLQDRGARPRDIGMTITFTPRLPRTQLHGSTWIPRETGAGDCSIIVLSGSVGIICSARACGFGSLVCA